MHHRPRSPHPERLGAHQELALFLLGHGLAGMLAGAITVAILLWSDVAGLGTLVATSDLWPLPLIMLLISFGLAFGSVALGTATVVVSRQSREAGHIVRLPAGAALRARPGRPARSRERRDH
jgi:hypothetical protein